MKNISLFLFTLLSVSCVPDSSTDSENFDTTQIKQKETARLERIVNPQNLANIYDFSGALHNKMIEIYLVNNYQFNTVPQIRQEIDRIVQHDTDVRLLHLEFNPSASNQELLAIARDPQTKLEKDIANSPLTEAAKNSFSKFMSSLKLLENDEYERIYQFIIFYESTVIASDQFTSEDKRIILITSSISRFSLYYGRKRKDKDWDSSVGNRAGAFSGAVSNSLTAVTNALVAGIMSNNFTK